MGRVSDWYKRASLEKKDLQTIRKQQKKQKNDKITARGVFQIIRLVISSCVTSIILYKVVLWVSCVDMKTVHINDAEVVKNPHGVKSQKLYTSEHASVMHLTLEPEERLKQHITPVDVYFYVLEGIGIVEIGEEKKEVGKDTLIDSPKGIMHCWYNESNEKLRILVSKVPFPTAPTKIL